MLVWQQYKQGLSNKVRKKGISFVLTSVRNYEEIVKVARIEIYGFMAWLKGCIITHVECPVKYHMLNGAGHDEAGWTDIAPAARLV
jgi:hypothetical protein